METATETRTLEIPSENLPALREALARIEKRARRLRVAAPVLTVGAGVDKIVVVSVPCEDDSEITDHTARKWVKRAVTTHAVTVVGTTPVLPGGWSLVARIDHIDGGNIVASVPGAGEMPESYRTDAPTCDHCRAARKRVETFVCRDADGRFVRVGRQCLGAFLGASSLNPNAIAALFEMLAEAFAAGDRGESYGGGGSGGGYDAVRFTATAIAVIREIGWTSGKEAYQLGCMSTRGHIENQLDPKWRMGHRDDVVDVTDDDYTRAELVREWAQSNEGDSDFDHNCRVVGAAEWLSGKHAGIAAYLPVGYDRAQNQLAHKRLMASYPESTHYGAVGTRARGIAVRVIAVGTPRETEWGTSTLITFRMATGEILKTWASNPSSSWERGADVVIDATPTKHDVYNGARETVCNRVAEHVAKAPKAKRERKAKSTET